MATTPTHKDLIKQTAAILKTYVTCVVDYKTNEDVTITLEERATHFNDDKRAGDFILGYATGLMTGIDITIKKQKKFFNENNF